MHSGSSKEELHLHHIRAPGTHQHESSSLSRARVSKHHYIFLNTRDRISGEVYRAAWSLNVPEFENVRSAHISLVSVSFANAVYPINTQNNKVYFQENSGSILTGTLTPGFYTGATFAAELQSTMNSTGSSVYTVSYNTANKRLTITVSLGDFNFVQGDRNPYEEMGFDDTPFSAQSSIASAYPIDISGTKHVDITSNFRTQTFASRYSTNMLVHIPLNAAFGEIVTYTPPEPHHMHIDDTGLHEISLVMHNEKGLMYELPETHHVIYTFRLDVIES